METNLMSCARSWLSRVVPVGVALALLVPLNAAGAASHPAPSWHGVLTKAPANQKLGGGRFDEVAAFGRNDAVAFGARHRANTPHHCFTPIVYRWNGKAWRPWARAGHFPAHNPGCGGAVFGMSATSDVWLTTQKPVGCRIEHWNGHRWRIITQRGLTHGLKGFAISATSGQVWVGGYNGNGNSLIARFIATPGHHHWQQAPALQDTVILGLAAAARHNVWAVGASRSRRPVIAHWNGASWRVSATPDVRGGLGAVAVNTANDVLAVGTDTSSATQIAPLALHWDGSTWSRTSAPPLPAADLSTVVGAGHGAFWTAGTNADDPQRTYYLRYSAAGWRAESGPTRTIPGTAGGPDPDQYVEVTGLARVPDTSQVWAVGFDAANDCVSSCGRSRAGDLIIDRYK